MNSLTYLSRQFDVLAAAKTPPSTPTTISSRPSFIADGHADAPETLLKRVATWSTKSVLFPQPRKRTLSNKPKRSHSSPSDLLTLASLQRSTAPPPSQDVPVRPSSTSLHILLRRIFFIKMFVMAWDALCNTWSSYICRWKIRRKKTAPVDMDRTQNHVVKVEEGEKSLVISQDDVELQPIIIVPRRQTDSLAPAEVRGPPSQSPISPTSPTTPVSTSRSPTPALQTKKTPFHLPKTLVLDLDETLIHSTSRPMHISTGGSGFFSLGSFGFGRRNSGSGHTVEVVLGGKSTLYHVYKRPFVDFFLRTVSGWYTLVIFTASMQEYADPVIDWLDAGRGILGRRLFRDSCTQLPNGSYTKNLSIIEEDLSRVCLIDNSPVSYRINEANGIPIEGWTSDPSDEALLDLLPVLDSLRFTSDVRRVLGLRCAGSHSS